MGGKPRRCNENWTWEQVEQYESAFALVKQMNGKFAPTKNAALADRVDYLDAYCRAINAYRDD